MIDKRKFKGVDILHVGLKSILFELNYLNDYIEETATTLYQKQKDLEKEYENAKKHRTEKDDDGELDMFFSDEFHRIHELFPSFTFNSILVSQFSFFESRLKLICDLYARKKFSNVKLSHLAGSDIEKCKRYITVVAGVDFDDFITKWKKISDIQKLRNAIIHNSSKLANEKENENIIQFINSDKRIQYFEKHGNFYINDVSFLEDFSKLIIDFFTQLVDRLSSIKVIARNTTMPYDNTLWGQEKVETLLKQIIIGVKLINDNEKRTDEFKDTDLKANIKGILGSMTYSLTKIYAFFCDGRWEVEDRDIIIKRGNEGLEYLNKIYGRQTLPEDDNDKK